MLSSGNVRIYFGVYFIIFFEFRLCNYGRCGCLRELWVSNS